ncbi:flavin reductase family protein [Rugosimonospora africana]|uniref:Flavin reductase n=1 Tax=Rugosimonospora africana TaxID=556532 RepID=A0A8J3VQL3_9ACTN|nr:flavin reductase family protein [Rugosimonospora africana]GIH14458.1 flavin reductase [Rugosimonospora africana]
MSDATPASESDFLAVMAEVCSPVTVVTSIEDGQPRGSTVSSFASLSLRPPMVVVALGESSKLLAGLRRTRRFGVNILASDQDGVARRFAGRGGDKFRDVSWTETDGLPRLHDAIGWIVCRVDAFVAGGDHVLVPGVVERAVAEPGAPLAYHRRTYGTHSESVRPVR